MKKIWVPLLRIGLGLLVSGSVQVRAASPAHAPAHAHIHGQVLAAATGPDGSGPAAAQATVINFGGLTIGNAYDPVNVVIKPGENVSWEGDFTVHPLVSDSGLWTTVSTGTKFEFVFNTVGVYPYHCLIHGTFGMAGTVTVGYQVFLADVRK